MPKLTCVCGFVHDLSPTPDEGWVAVRDRDYEKLIAAEVALSKQTGPPAAAGDEHQAVIFETTVCLYECPECGVLAWFAGGDQPERFFRPVTEIGKPCLALLRSPSTNCGTRLRH
jgi:hypothetical protein